MFDNCRHKICKCWEEMFLLQNIICPIENQIGESLLMDLQRILLEAS